MTRADALVLFGATGDLARKKLFSALYHLEARERLNLPVIGVALSDWDDEQFREHARSAIGAMVKGPDPVVVQRLCQRLSLVGGDYGREETFPLLAGRLRALRSRHAVVYLAIPPSMFPAVVQGLASVGLTDTARIVVEKPFGRDLASAQQPNRVLHEHLKERAMRPLDCTTMVRGQYQGYLDEAGVGADSTVETLVACRLQIESWRWPGVPFFVRAGKGLAATTLEAVVEFREPRMLFTDKDLPGPHPNPFRFRLGHQDGVTLAVQAKRPGQELASEPVDLQVDFSDALGQRQEAYERLLDDALDADPRRFVRADGVESTWRVVQAAPENLGQIHPYQRGTWGPVEADDLLQGGHWRAPQAGLPPHVPDQHARA